MTYAAFDYADRDRNPVLILADGVIGTMMEPVVLPDMKSEEELAASRRPSRAGPVWATSWTTPTAPGSSRATG